MNIINSNAPRVSVAIPLYRSARFIDIIIDNIEAMPKQDIEILVSDRHGYDDTIDRLIQRYDSDPRLRFFKHQDGLDWVGHINALLQEARGEYWRFLPHDDTSPAGSLELLILALDTHKEAILAYGPSQAVDLEGNRLPEHDHWHPQPPQVENSSTLGIALEMCWNWNVYAGSFKGLVRRKVLLENKLLLRSTIGQVIPDRCWQFALCLLGRFHFVPEAIYIKRYYPGSTSQKWAFKSYTYYSAAWVMSTYLWGLLGPAPARRYALWDVWLNAMRLALRRFRINRLRPFSYLAAPDLPCLLVNRVLRLKTPYFQKFSESRQRKIDLLRMMTLPQKRQW